MSGKLSPEWHQQVSEQLQRIVSLAGRPREVVREVCDDVARNLTQLVVTPDWVHEPADENARSRQ